MSGASGRLDSMNETPPPSPATAIVRLVGGPDDWRETTLTHLSPEELAGDRETLGAYLVSSCVPLGHPDPGARAVYEPNADPYPPSVWFFRGWVPWWHGDPEERRADHHEQADVEVGGLLPTEWVTENGIRHRVDRILAHWQASGDDQLAPDVWHVRSGDQDWELYHHGVDMWEAGRLP